MTFETITGASCWASYLVNGDDSGIDATEKAQADSWRERNAVVNVVDCSEEESFTWAYRIHVPESQFVGGSVVDYTCEIKPAIDPQ